jgi:cytochrome bd-type quinol oxidase subunit 2
LPTVGLSSQIEQAVYIASIVGLLLLLARPAYLVFSASQERGAEAVAAGLASVIGSMRPGTTLICALPAYPGVSLTADLAGTIIIVNLDGSRANATVRWHVDPITLTAGESFSLTLQNDGEVKVAALAPR